MLIEFGAKSVRISAELFDKDGSVINENIFHSHSDKLSALGSKKKNLKPKQSMRLDKFIENIRAKENKKAEKFVKKNRADVDQRLNEAIRLLLEMRVVIQ